MRDDSLMLDFGDTAISPAIQNIAEQLALLSERTDWWGSARIAFDAVIDGYQVRAHTLALEAKGLGP